MIVVRLNAEYLEHKLDAARSDFREIEEWARKGREALEDMCEEDFDVDKSSTAAYNALDKIQVLAAKVLKGI